MNILVIPRDSGCLGLADRLVRESNDITVWTPNSKTGRGIWKTVSGDEVWSHVKDCKFILTDCDLDESIERRIKMYNRPIIGTNVYASRLNRDCVAEYGLCEKFKIPTPKTAVANDVASMFEITQDWKISSFDLRYARHDFSGEKVQFMSWAIMQLPVDTPFLMQEPTREDAIIRVHGFFNGQDFYKPFFVSAGGEERSWDFIGVLDEKSSLPVQNLNKLTEWLRVVDYRGPVCATLLMVGEKLLTYRFHIGWTFPVTYAILETLNTTLTALLNGMAFSIPTNFTTRGRYAAAVTTSINDYQHMEGAPVLGLGNVDCLRHSFPQGVMKSELMDSDMYVSGEYEEVYTTCAYAYERRKVRQRIYRGIERVPFPEMKFNPNIHEQSEATFQLLSKGNYLNV